MFANFKRAAMPIGQSLEKRLRSMYPHMEVSFFRSVDPNVLDTETSNKDKFTAWVKGVDDVILMVGD